MIPNEGEATLLIFDMTGKQVFQREIFEGSYGETIQVDHFSKGVYFLSMSTESESKTVKFFKL